MVNNGGSYQKNGGYGPIPDEEDGVMMNGHSKGEGPWKKLVVATGAIMLIGFVGYEVFNPKETASVQVAKSADVQVDSSGKLKLFDKFDRYVLEDYDDKPTFTNFLPGVAGYYGKPMWSFIVNRGQAMATFGTESKEYPILEFNAANKAYQLTPFVGFRSFVRGTRAFSSFESEPFGASKTRNLAKSAAANADLPKRIMYVGRNDLEIQEFDAVNDLKVSVKYFTLPNEDFASLVRRSTYANTGSTELKLSILDGLAKMEPSGGKLDWSFKNMGRTLEGWMGVYHAHDSLTMPFYKMSTEPSDTASVKIEEAGHYCLSFLESADTTPELLPIVFDSNKVFGRTTSLERASGLAASSVKEILANPQHGDAKTSSAFAAIDEITLAPGEEITIASFYGKAFHIKELDDIVKIITEPNYVESKFQQAREMIDSLTQGVETNTANNLFNGAVRQMFLDNSLRGGMPTILGNVDSDKTYDEDPGVKIFHAFSRIHGDLERDYNAFKIVPSYFSQGPGNFRDIAQNRRNDVTFLPRLASYDVQVFLSYIQADGYEPLTVEAISYVIEDDELAQSLGEQLCADKRSVSVLKDVLLGGPFRPGQLFELVDQLNINVTASNEEFINTIVAASTDRVMGVYGSGYWADHWDYYVDLIEAYTAIFPDGEEHLMYDVELRYFFSTATVKPRSEKYILTFTFDGKSKHVLQLDSTFFDDEKEAEQKAFLDQSTGLLGIDAHWQRTTGGKAFMSSPLAKLFLLGAVKFAMRDAYGMGIEYEGGRPGWNDAMNGLPGMVGSGMPETYEMYLLLKYVRKVADTHKRSIMIPIELNNMVTTVNKALDDLESSGFQEPEVLPRDVPEELFLYWDIVAAARENYRNDVQYYFSGETVEISASELIAIIDRWLEQVEIGMARAMQIGSHGFGDDGTTGIAPCYFSYEVTDWELNGGKNDVGLPTVNAKAMRVGNFPLFLEGPVRYMKTVGDDKEKMKDMYERVLKSGLRDEKLKMYFLSASLEGQSYDMGRMMAFAPGWLENQSIWMHMSYKYYLQLLRGKLYDEFFAEMKGGGILPFMDPIVYGRSLMECSSFMASSAFPDESMHGRGFLPRLSGSTAEFMSMYVLMMIGPEPFFINDDGDVEMRLVPALPAWLFEDDENEGTRDDDGSLVVTYKLFGEIVTTYHNSGGGNLYGVSPSSYKVLMKSGDVVDIEGPIIPTETAKAIRRVKGVAAVDAYF